MDVGIPGSMQGVWCILGWTFVYTAPVWPVLTGLVQLGGRDVPDLTVAHSTTPEPRHALSTQTVVCVCVCY